MLLFHFAYFGETGGARLFGSTATVLAFFCVLRTRPVCVCSFNLKCFYLGGSNSNTPPVYVPLSYDNMERQLSEALQQRPIIKAEVDKLS
jgi:hypothetical protein